MEPLAAFSANVRRLRHERGLTQERLAQEAGLNLSDIARIETARRDPGAKVVAKIARGLGVPTAELMVVSNMAPTAERQVDDDGASKLLPKTYIRPQLSR